MAKIGGNTAYFRLLECELFKITHNKWLLLLWLLPAFLVILAFGYMLLSYREFTLDGLMAYPYNPFDKTVYVLFKAYQFTFAFIIAMMAACFFIMEQHGNGGELCKTFPYSRTTLLGIRFFLLLLMVFTAILLAYFIFLCGGRLCEAFGPLLMFGEYDMRLESAIFFSRLFFAAFCIAFLQYGLHLLTNNWYIPLILTFLGNSFALMPEKYEIIDVYYAVGYLRSISNEFSSGGIDYQWQYLPVMLLAPVVVTLLCFVIKRRFILSKISFLSQDKIESLHNRY